MQIPPAVLIYFNEIIMYIDICLLLHTQKIWTQHNSQAYVNSDKTYRLWYYVIKV